MTAPTDETICRESLQLATRALPVNEARPLVQAITETWSHLFDCEVVVCVASEDLAVVGHQLINQPTVFAQKRLGKWNRTDWLTSTRVIVKLPTEAPTMVLPFVMNGEHCGGLACWGVNIEEQQLAPLFDISLKLVTQWLIQERDLRNRKLEAMAEFAAGAGHEINNPLATIAGRANLLLRTETAPERRRSLETIGGQAYRVRDMIGDAMTFARPPQPQPQLISPIPEIRSVLTSFEDRLKLAGISLNISGDESIKLSADREQFRVFVACLLRNELEALSRGGTCSIEVAAVESDQQPLVRIKLQDDGPGLTEIDCEHLFDPFYSGRPAGRGLGFGLSKCWRIVRLHGGNIDAGGDRESGFWLVADWPTNG